MASFLKDNASRSCLMLVNTPGFILQHSVDPCGRRGYLLLHGFNTIKNIDDGGFIITVPSHPCVSKNNQYEILISIILFIPYVVLFESHL